MSQTEFSVGGIVCVSFSDIFCPLPAFTENRASTLILHAKAFFSSLEFLVVAKPVGPGKNGWDGAPEASNYVIFAKMGGEWGGRLNRIQQATFWGALPIPSPLFPQVTFFFWTIWPSRAQYITAPCPEVERYSSRGPSWWEWAQETVKWVHFQGLLLHFCSEWGEEGGEESSASFTKNLSAHLFPAPTGFHQAYLHKKYTKW